MASHTVSHSSIVQQISRNGTLMVWGFGSHLRVQNGQLCAEWGIGQERHRVRLPRINRHLKRIIVVGSDGFATFDAIRWIADVGASLIFLDRRGKLLFVSGPTAPSNSRLRRAQSLSISNGTALGISKQLIAEKMDGQATLVRDMLGNSAAADAILRFKGELSEVDTLDKVRILEGQAAKIYWSQWVHLPIRWPKQEEHRVAEHWKKFKSRISPLTRSPRLAANPPNACMNLLHAICEAQCRIALIAAGLDSEIGLLHVDAPNRSSLANDLQEILRPKVDAFVLNWMQSELFRKADFFEDRNGNCRITTALAVKLCGTSQVWYRFVAPWAEYVARTLWASTSPAKSERLLSTPLTQRHRRMAKGSLEFPQVKTPKPQRLCRGCGKKIRGDSFNCKRCDLEIATKRLVEVAHAGRIAGHTPDAIAKEAATHRKHAQARAAWNPAMQLAWLTEKFFSEKIQPALGQVSATLIAKRIGVSRQYAACIRGGYRPDARHWKSLSELVGVSGHLE